MKSTAEQSRNAPVQVSDAMCVFGRKDSGK
jgi:hypothetical protein